MSTARVTSLVLEVLAPDDFTGATTTVGAGAGGGTVTATTERSTRIVGGGSGGGSLRGGSAPAGTGSVDYAEVIDGRVVGIYTGPLPVSTSEVLFIDLTEYAITPGVDWYWSEICQTFSETEPTVPPGDIVPPWSKPKDGTNGKDGTDGAEGGEGPIPLAFTMPVLIPFHADGGNGLTITNVPVALTEVTPRMRTAYDLTDVCAIRLQCDVRTAASAELVLQYSTDNGATWAPVGDPIDYSAEGPFVRISSTGDQRGAFLNPVEDARTEVLLSIFSRNGNGSSDPVVGNLGALCYTKTSSGACSLIETEVENCPVLAAVSLLGWGLLSDNFATAFAYGLYTGNGLVLYACTDDTSSVVGGALMGTSDSASIFSNGIGRSLAPAIHYDPTGLVNLFGFYDVTVRIVLQASADVNLDDVYGTQLVAACVGYAMGFGDDVYVCLIRHSDLVWRWGINPSSSEYAAWTETQSAIDPDSLATDGVWDIRINMQTTGNELVHIEDGGCSYTVTVNGVTVASGSRSGNVSTAGLTWFNHGLVSATPAVTVPRRADNYPHILLRAMEAMET